ncbi:hypothetical protein G3M48_010391 [Beauveria asiatica]|uniref:NADP-dependent oxidoreductase domain-containing protein n=1 Tax=Beauveria asiatica TaxID=1069075 RepID=A0AAW0S1B8_9HYPO
MPFSEYIQLNDGNKIPLIAFGVGTSVSRRWGNPEGLPELLKTALQAGYRHIDTAEANMLPLVEYENENEVAEGIRMSGVPRKDIFITAKDLSIKGVTTEQALRKTLQNLGVEYVDLYLIHNAMFAKNDADLQRKWAEMEAVKELGLAKSIGVSNLEQQRIQAILKTAKVPPAINQIELHPYFQRTELVSWLQQQNIALACYSPLAPLRSGSFGGRPGPVDDIFQALAKKYNVDESEIGLRWAIDQGHVVITTSSKPERIQGYAKKLPSFKLTTDEISDIAELGRKKAFAAFWHAFAPSGGDNFRLLSSRREDLIQDNWPKHNINAKSADIVDTWGPAELLSASSHEGPFAMWIGREILCTEDFKGNQYHWNEAFDLNHVS